MKMRYWSGYAKYLVLADRAGSNKRLKGDYLSYQDFLIVKSILERLAKSDNSNYLYDSILYNRKVTSAEAKGILANLEVCKWTVINNKMFLVASQVGLRI